MPRHPPCALINLATKHKIKMLASTVQFSRYGRPDRLIHRVRLSGRRSVIERPDVFGIRAPDHSGHHESLRATIPLPQDSTACLRSDVIGSKFLRCKHRCTNRPISASHELVSVPPLSSARETFAHESALDRSASRPALCSLERR